MQQQKKKGSLISLLKQKNILSNYSDIDFSQKKIAVFNTEAAFYFYNTDYRDFLVNCESIAIDGVFLKLGLKLLGFDVPRYHGPDLFSDIVNNSSLPLFLLGGQKENLNLVNDGIIKGYLNLPFGDVDSLINYFQVNHLSKIPHQCVIFVSLGLPKQELFSLKLSELLSDHLSSNVLLIPIGAAADFMNGTKKRSSLFFQKYGLEWLPRLIREPRMFSRNVRSLIAFFMVLIYR
jgi:N-acetylglucosaminyldiphosphoundecaprenol N-acetyl-beta-D-mannosaminyltransferase